MQEERRPRLARSYGGCATVVLASLVPKYPFWDIIIASLNDLIVDPIRCLVSLSPCQVRRDKARMRNLPER